MSYEPTLIIRKKDFNKIIHELEKEQYDDDVDKVRVAEYLLEINIKKPIKFDDLELVLCSPVYSSFNALVRERLKKGGLISERIGSTNYKHNCSAWNVCLTCSNIIL